jgi:hypothetical protein
MNKFNINKKMMLTTMNIIQRPIKTMIKLLVSLRVPKIIKMNKTALKILKINKRLIKTTKKWTKKPIMRTKWRLITCKEGLFLNKCLLKGTLKCL